MGEVGRKGKFWDGSKLVVITLFATKNRRKKKGSGTLMSSLFSVQIETKK